MKVFSYDLLPDRGLAVLTAPDIDGSGPMYLADFRDSQVLIFKPSGHFLGFSRERGVLLCKGPLRMQDGLWTANPDEQANSSHTDVQLKAETLDFRAV